MEQKWELISNAIKCTHSNPANIVGECEKPWENGSCEIGLWEAENFGMKLSIGVSSSAKCCEKKNSRNSQNFGLFVAGQFSSCNNYKIGGFDWTSGRNFTKPVPNFDESGKMVLQFLA